MYQQSQEWLLSQLIKGSEGGREKAQCGAVTAGVITKLITLHSPSHEQT
jgi:hypothetical protein